MRSIYFTHIDIWTWEVVSVKKHGMGMTMALKKLELGLPRFKTTSSFNLGSILKNMGIKSSFSPCPADFSGMDGTRKLFVSEVVHKAFVDVNEKGTEAAAATAVSMQKLGIMEPKKEEISRAGSRSGPGCPWRNFTAWMIGLNIPGKGAFQ
jgi:serine protease inhibitor